MGKREAFKRIMSLFLSLAMAVTLLPVQMAYAQNDSMPGGEARVSTPGDAKPELDESLKNPLCYFGFENESELTGKVVGEAAGAALKKDDGYKGQSALYLNGKAFIKALEGAQLNGKTELTISYWSKPDKDGNAGWAFFAAKDNLAALTPEYYIGVLDKSDKIAVERYKNGRPSGSSGETKDPAAGWRQVTVVFHAGKTEIYVNNERKLELTTGQSALTEILSNKSVLKIGSANWGRVGGNGAVAEDKVGEAYKGYMDDFTVYDKALSSEQVENLYNYRLGVHFLSDSFERVSERTVCVYKGRGCDLKGNVKAPVGGTLSYTSANPQIATVDKNGIVEGVEAGSTKITVTASCCGLTREIEIPLTVKDAAGGLQPIASYQFDVTGDNGLVLEKDVTPLVKGLTAYSGQRKYDAGRKGTALKADGYGVQLPHKDIGDYTVSLWVKREKFTEENIPIIQVGYHNPEKWVSVSSTNNQNGETYKVWSNDIKDDNVNWKTVKDIDISPNKWTMVTLSQSGKTLSIYKDGKLEGSGEAAYAFEGNDQGIYLGVNNWNTCFGGLIDDVNLYDTALNANEVEDIYLKSSTPEELAAYLGILGEKNQAADFITDDLTLPERKGTADISWKSANTVKITDKGEVKAQDGSKVQLKATLAFSDKSTREVPFELVLAREVTVKAVDAGTDAAIAGMDQTLYLKEGSKYTYTDIEDVLATEEAVYQYDKDSNKNKLTIEKVGAQDHALTVAYKKLKVGKVDPLQDIYVIEGNTPILPEKVSAAVSPDDGSAAQEKTGAETAGIKVKIPVTWSKTPDITTLKASETPYTITGKFADRTVSVKVMVYECDEDVGTAKAGMEMHKFKDNRVYKGKIIAEYDIAAGDNWNTNDMTMIYTDAADATDGNVWGKSGPRLDFNGDKKDNKITTKAYFRTQNGDGKGGSTGNYPGSTYNAEYLQCEKEKVYRVRMEIDDAVSGGLYKTWITEPDGTVTELFEGNGNTFRGYTGNGIQNFLAGRIGFNVLNHKIYWAEGYATKKVEFYVGNVLKDTKTSKEMAGKYKYKPEDTLELEGDDNLYILEPEKSGWVDSEGKVVPDLDADGNNGTKESLEAAAGDTVTYKAYYVLKANIKGLERAIKDAETAKTKAVKAKTYTEESLAALQGRIDAAQKVLNDNKDADLMADNVIQAVRDAINTLKEAQIKEVLKPKKLEQLKEYLNTFYKLDKCSSEGEGANAVKKVKDESGNGHDGTVHGNVTLDRDTGAVLPGSEQPRKNYIELPNDLDVTDQMTFSFWAYREEGVSGQHNTFGISSGEKIADSSTAAVTGHHFSIYAGREGRLDADGGADAWRGVKGVQVPGFETGRWHFVTCVVNGTDLEVYDDGKAAGAGEIGITLTEVWNAEQATRHIFIGNNVYSYNNDKDYKGSVKNFRIYNASFAAEQVKELYDMEAELPMQNAIADVLQALGAREENGKYLKEILAETDTVDINLPQKGKQGETIEWKAYAEDGVTESSDVIDVAAKKVKVPATVGTTAKAVLKAVITLGTDTKTIAISYEVTKVMSGLDRTGLTASLATADALNPADYTVSSWDAFKKIRDEVRQANKTAASQTDIDNAKKRLDDAMKTDGSGTLVLLGNKAELNKAISNANEVMSGRDKSDYTGDYASAWTTLETKLAAANTVKGSDDVSQNQVDTAKNELIQAVAEFVDATLAIKISAAKAAKQGKNESDYPMPVWKELTDAIADAEELKDDEEASQEEKLAACDRLDEAIAKFKPIDKAEADALKEKAKAAMEGKKETDYEEAVWKELLEAVEAYENLPENASSAEVIEAYNRMYAALENFKPIDRKAAQALREKAEEAMEGKDRADYEEAVWTELLEAIEACKNLPEDASGAEVIEAYNRLNAALKNFVPKTVVAVTGVTLDRATLTLAVGVSETLKASVQPENASNQEVTWQTDNPNVATVENGTVTGKAAGTAVITAASAADSAKYAACTVTVTAAGDQGNQGGQGGQGGQDNVQPTVKASSVKLNVKKLTMGLKESYSLKATVGPAGAANKAVTWKSSNKKVVSVKNGKLKALKAGKAKITAASAENQNIKATVTVTVKKAPTKKAKVTLNKKSVTLKLKGKSKTFQIKPKVSSAFGSATFKYTIDKKGKKAVKVDQNGKVTARKKGKAVITVKTYNGKAKAVLKVTVK